MEDKEVLDKAFTLLAEWIINEGYDIILGLYSTNEIKNYFINKAKNIS